MEDFIFMNSEKKEKWQQEDCNVFVSFIVAAFIYDQSSLYNLCWRNGNMPMYSVYFWP